MSDNSDCNLRTRVGKFELGRTLGSGSFAKVKHGKNVETGKQFAVKILEKEKILKEKMAEQIKREISIMKLVKHPNIVELHEVLASKTKIFFILEYVTGGELFNKIARQGKLTENEARKYFQQIINAVDYCHSRGVYHRDLKPENLLLDSQGDLKISDFGLSALPQQLREDGLLHTTCGTPNYVAPEVIVDRGYDGAKADLWSCGVILFILMAGYLPFDETNLIDLYRKIYKADFSYPPWFSPRAKHLITRLLTPNPKHRIDVPQILQDSWFKKGYKPENRVFFQDVKLDDVDAVFNTEWNLSSSFMVRDRVVTEQSEPNSLNSSNSSNSPNSSKPTLLNAFELISLNKELNLSGMFKKKEEMKLVSRFASKLPALEIISKMEEMAKPLGFNVQKCGYKMKLEGAETDCKGHLSIATEVFEVAPSLFLVEVRKAGGDTLEYHKFYQNFSTALKDIVCVSEEVDATA